MSASREKKRRQNVTPGETAGTGAAKAKKGMNRTLKRVLITIAAVVIIAAIVFLGMVSTGFFAKHGAAAVASGHKLSPAMVNYFYGAAYSSNSQTLSYFADTSSPLDEQEFPGESYETWADYLLDMALQNAASAYAIYDEAMANGYTLSEDEAAAIDYQLQLAQLYGAYSYGSTDAYLAAQFGTGCTEDSYREYLTVTTIADAYTDSVTAGFTYSQDQIDAYYGENADSFDAVNYRLFSINVDSAAEDQDAALAECEETAKAMAEASQGDEETFLALCLENTAEENQESYDADSATLRQDGVKASLPEAYQEWLSDSARQPGDTTYIANGEIGYYVLYFIENVDHSYLLPNVRHILVYVSDTTDEEAMAAAQEEAQAILDEFLSGDQTEESFAALADEKSDDTAEGGLIAEIAPNTMVENFENWAYDESRQVGDTGIVESSYGYHVMYYSGLSDVTYQNYLVETTLRSIDSSDWYAAATAGASYTTNAFFMHFSAV